MEHAVVGRFPNKAPQPTTVMNSAYCSATACEPAGEHGRGELLSSLRIFVMTSLKASQSPISIRKPEI